MICVTRLDTILAGPMPYDPVAVFDAIKPLGFVLRGAVLHTPDGEESPMQIPADEPEAAYVMPEYVFILPAVEVDEPAPPGKVIGGRVPVITGDRVELAPVWADAPPAPSLAEVKAAKQAEIVATADAFLTPLGLEYGPTERQTWDQQAAEARALQADPSAPAVLIRTMAAARGMEVGVLAGRILANEATWKVIAGHVIGQRQAYQDQLDAADTVEAVSAIVPTYSLPQG